MTFSSWCFKAATTSTTIRAGPSCKSICDRLRKASEQEIVMKQFLHPGREEITLSGVLHALSDPVRLFVVFNLMGQEAELPCGHFEVPVHKSTMSHHLRVLR